MACLLYRAQINLFYSVFFCQGMANDAVRFIYGEVFNESAFCRPTARGFHLERPQTGQAPKNSDCGTVAAAEKFNQDEERTY
jgi:hypothetical protein